MTCERFQAQRTVAEDHWPYACPTAFSPYNNLQAITLLAHAWARIGLLRPLPTPAVCEQACDDEQQWRASRLGSPATDAGRSWDAPGARRSPKSPFGIREHDQQSTSLDPNGRSDAGGLANNVANNRLSHLFLICPAGRIVPRY
jgi:hypothetical protein